MGARRSLARTGAAAVGLGALLWAPALLMELVYPAAFREIVVSPVLLRELGMAAGLWGLALLAGAVAAGATAWASVVSDRQGESGSAPGPGPWLPALLWASVALVALRAPVQRAVTGSTSSPWPALAALLLAAVALGAGAGLAVGAATARGRGLERGAVAIGGLAWLGFWWRETGAAGAVVLFATTAVPIVLWALALPAARRRTLVAGAAASLVAAVAVTAVLQPRPARTVQQPRTVGTPEGARRPNVVVVMVDTVRTDRTAIGGVPITPRLASLAASPQTTVFTTAMSPAASTVPSVKALFTARSPSAWGLRTAGSEPPPPDVWTLASAFRRAGYATGAFSANGLIEGGGFESGFERFWSAGGFDFFRGSYFLYRLLASGRYWWSLRTVDELGTHKVGGETVLAQGLAWMEEEARSRRPFFAYLHLVEPHWPFESHGYGLVPDELRDLEPVFGHVDLLRLPKGDPRNAPLRVAPQMREMDGRYREEIHRADRLLGTVLDRLEAAGIDDGTLIVFVADHGEEFFEHNGFGHGHDVFDEQIRVPLVLRWPTGWTRAPRRVDAPVSSIDLAPTLVDLLGLGPMPSRLAGRSLAPALGGEETFRPVIAESYHAGWCRAAYREGSLKVRLEFSPAEPPEATPRVMLFDLEADPEEMRPLLGEVLAAEPYAAVVARARVALQRRWHAWPERRALAAEERGGEAADDPALEQLRSLGYVD